VLTAQGTAVGITVTGALAANLNLLTAVVAQHGHIYLGASPDGAWQEDALDPGFINDVNLLETSLLTQLTFGGAGTADLAVYSKKLHTAEAVTGIALAPQPCALPRRTRPFG
jgi:hypothetical protein